VDLNTLYTATRAGCDGLACTQLSLVDWPRAARTAGRCGAGVTIAIVDTGINPEHGSLAEADVTLLPLLGGEPQRSRRSHGTAVAAVLVGSGDPRIQGLLPAARLIAVDAFEEDPEGRTHSDAFRLVSAIDLVHGKGPDVINLSLTGPANALLERAVAAVADDGVPLVAAVGNAGPAADPLYPAAYDRVIAATAVDADRRIYRRAVRGEHVDFAAPGVRVWTAASVRGARPKTGTSFAAPFVSGAAALARQQGASSPEAVMETLKRSAEDLGEGGRDPVFGWGLLNAAGLCGAAPAGADAVVAEASADADAADSFGLAGE
jgi:subtilisin family serine protease